MDFRLLIISSSSAVLLPLVFASTSPEFPLDSNVKLRRGADVDDALSFRSLVIQLLSPRTRLSDERDVIEELFETELEGVHVCRRGE